MILTHMQLNSLRNVGERNPILKKIEEIVAKHKRPANCPELKPLRVNPEIWRQLTATQKKAALKLTNFQQLVCKVTIIKLQTTDWLASNTQNNTDLITKSVDSLAVLGHLNTQLAQLRRVQVQPTLKPEYNQICAIEVPVNSQYLFGVDIAKQLKDVRETSKISRSVAHTSNKKPNGNYPPFSQNDRGEFSNNYKGKSQSRNFLWQNRSKPFRQQTPQGQRTDSKSLNN